MSTGEVIAALSHAVREAAAAAAPEPLPGPLALNPSPAGGGDDSLLLQAPLGDGPNIPGYLRCALGGPPIRFKPLSAPAAEAAAAGLWAAKAAHEASHGGAPISLAAFAALHLRGPVGAPAPGGAAAAYAFHHSLDVHGGDADACPTLALTAAVLGGRLPESARGDGAAQLRAVAEAAALLATRAGGALRASALRQMVGRAFPRRAAGRLEALLAAAAAVAPGPDAELLNASALSADLFAALRGEAPAGPFSSALLAQHLSDAEAAAERALAELGAAAAEAGGSGRPPAWSALAPRLAAAAGLPAGGEGAAAVGRWLTAAGLLRSDEAPAGAAGLDAAALARLLPRLRAECAIRPDGGFDADAALAWCRSA